MTNLEELEGFERRLLLSLTDIDNRRPVASPGPVTVAQPKHQRSRQRLMVVVTAITLGLGTTAVAAASGLFEPAPPQVKRIFGELNQDGLAVDAKKAVRVGVIDDHVAYAAPAVGGGFCLYFGPNPRSGPTGSACLERDGHRDEAMFSVLPGTDGGLLFGRVTDPRASAVEITFPQGTGTLRTPVMESGFFGVTIPDPAMRTMMIEVRPKPGPDGVVKEQPPTKDGGPILSFDLSRVAAISIVAVDAQGNSIAHGVPVTPSDTEEQTSTPQPQSSSTSS
jgi:hypothetical protein